MVHIQLEMLSGIDWAYGLMDMTSVYETEDCRFEPCFAHTFVLSRLPRG